MELIRARFIRHSGAAVQHDRSGCSELRDVSVKTGKIRSQFRVLQGKSRTDVDPVIPEWIIRIVHILGKDPEQRINRQKSSVCEPLVLFDI